MIALILFCDIICGRNLMEKQPNFSTNEVPDKTANDTETNRR